MVRAMLKLSLRQIRASLGRFLAIFGIVALGVGFFCGLRLTKTAMIHTLDVYADEQNFYDYRIVCTLGLSDDELETVRAQKTVAQAEGAVGQDAVCSVGGQTAMALHSMSVPQQVNLLKLQQGRLPENETECVLDAWRFDESIIGQTLTITADNDQDTLDAFENHTFTVVGLVNSPLYVNYERGSTSVGEGTLQGFFCILPEAYTLDYYTDIYLTLSGAGGEVYSDAYQDAIDACEPQMTALSERLASSRDESVRLEARLELDDARRTLEEKTQELLDGEQEIRDGEQTLQDGWQSYYDGQQELRDGREKADRELQDARQKLIDGQRELDEQAAQLPEKEAELLDAKQKLLDGQQQLDEAWAQYDEGYAAFKEGYFTADEQFSDAYQQLAGGQQQIDSAQKEISTQKVMLALGVLTGQVSAEELRQAQEQLDAAQKQLDAAQAQLDAGRAVLSSQQFGVDTQIKEASAQLCAAREVLLEKQAELDDGMRQVADGEAQLAEGKQKLKDAKRELADGWQSYYEGVEEAEQQIADSEQKLLDARQELEDGEKELADAKVELADGRQQLLDGEQEIKDGEQKLAELETAECYLLDRSSNTGYVCFDSDSNIVNSISRVFPLFFFLVAALVCITTMTRMVEEHRTEIGVLKAMGYSDGAIAGEYLFYTGSASALGCVVGIALGAYFLPKILWQGYNIMYGFSPILWAFDWPLALGSSAAYLAGALLATWFACANELTLQAAELIRPRAPKAGKRIFLEQLPFLWNRVKFLHKVSIRNILRYKKRMIMMVVGIGGCTALLLTGLGIGDSIQDLVNYQFGEIMLYDATVRFSDPMDEAEQEHFIEAHQDVITGQRFFAQKNLHCEANGKTKTAFITMAAGDNTAGFFDLHRDGESVAYPEDGACIICNALAEELDLGPGDEIVLRDDENLTTRLRVSAVFENYVANYVFVNEATWREQIESAPQYEQAWLTFGEDGDAFSAAATILPDSTVMNVSLCQEMRERFSNMMGSLNYIVATVVLFAGALMFVVLYNLTNINITERAREIATVKVLGFYDNETDLYVFRENFILTIFGALVGLPMGIWLHRFVMEQIKLDAICFDVRIAPGSYILALVLTLAFSVLASFILRGKIRKIDMAQALKSVE